uniref:Uncharacterized protein n=1 Tax=Lepeophtheirus salmonis TaxID=72036 RepID=A0A0K2VC52_LEPSM
MAMLRTVNVTVDIYFKSSLRKTFMV